jgi:hypothetical protein
MARGTASSSPASPRPGRLRAPSGADPPRDAKGGSPRALSRVLAARRRLAVQAGFEVAVVGRTATPVVMRHRRFAHSHSRRPCSAGGSRAAPLARQRDQAGTALLSNARCRPHHRAVGFNDVVPQPQPAARGRQRCARRTHVGPSRRDRHPLKGLFSALARGPAGVERRCPSSVVGAVIPGQGEGLQGRVNIYSI